MPIIVFRCENCKEDVELLIQTFSKSDKAKAVKHKKCGKWAKRVDFPGTLRPHFYGNHWEKPSPTKRDSYKLASFRTGNSNSAG